MIVTFREVLSSIRYFGIQPESTVVVFGCGPVGLTYIKFMSLLGVKNLIACDIIPEKLAQAGSYGAAHLINSKEGVGRALLPLPGHLLVDHPPVVVGLAEVNGDLLLLRHAVAQAGDDDLVPPDDGLAGLVQLPLEPVRVRGNRHAPHCAVGGNAGDGVGGEVGHIDVAVLVDAHAVGGLEVGRVLGPEDVLLHAAVGLEGDLVDRAVAEVADVEVAVMVKDNAVHAILALGAVVADNMEHPNGIRIRGDYMYVTQSCMNRQKTDSGKLICRPGQWPFRRGCRPDPPAAG